MKKLVLIAFAAFATSAFATEPSITVNGTSTQSAALIFAAATNKAEGSYAKAQQNLASNAGTVTVNGKSTQTLFATAAIMANKADGAYSYASQNLASNVGHVTVNGTSTQTVGLGIALVSNSAAYGAAAVQNIASNNACITCN